MQNPLDKVKIKVSYELVYKSFSAIAKFVSPVIYGFTWLGLLSLAYHWLPPQVTENDAFLIIYTIVFLFALIAKSAAWTIGTEYFGIKGDSRSRLINYHGSGNGDYWFDLFADNPELLKDEKVREFIKYITKKEEEK